MPAIAGVLLLAGAPAAFAHAGLVGTDPADGQVLAQPPRAVTVTFTEPIRLADSGNQLLDAAGASVAADVVARDDTVVFTPREALADGSYIVSWRVISVDTHPVAGGIMFSVGHPSAGVAPVAVSAGDRQVDLLRQIAVALRYAGILGFAGLVWFVLFIAPPGTRDAERFTIEARRAQRWLAATAVGAAVVVVPLATAWQNGYALSGFASVRLWADALGDPAAVVALLVAGCVALASAGVRRNRPLPAALGAAVALGSLVIEGHTRSFGPSWLVLSTDLLHLAAGAMWFGGLIGLVILLLPRRDLRLRDIATAVGRFSSAALWLVVALAGAAVVLWWRIGGSLSGLWQSYYGELVLVKGGLVLLVVAVAAWNRFRLVPAVLASAADSPSAAAPQLTRLRLTVGWEALALVAVLGVTAVMVSQQPPERAVAASPEQTVTATGEGVSASITLRPGALGTNALQLSLTDASGEPLTPQSVPTLAVRLVDTPVGPFTHPLSAIDPGDYQAIVDFPLAGRWAIDVTVRVSEFSAPVLSTEVMIR